MLREHRRILNQAAREAAVAERRQMLDTALARLRGLAGFEDAPSL